MRNPVNEITHNKIIEILQARLNQHLQRHSSIKWEDIEDKLTEKSLSVITNMEITGGEPDLIVMPDGRMAYIDCCIERTKDRKSLCYDRAA